MAPSDREFGQFVESFLQLNVRREVTGSVGSSEQGTQIDELRDRLDKLTLTCLAMWSLLQQTTKFTEEDLLERVKQIDLLDGTADGKITPQIMRCAKCNRVMSQRHKKCLYCGADRLIASAFDQIT